MIACITCRHLGNCMIVDEEKLMANYHCGDWREAPEPAVEARRRILYNFGPAGAKAVLNLPPPDMTGE